MRWSYGVTTVPSRRSTLLPRTLASLRMGGFDCPRLFVDGGTGDWYKSQGWLNPVTSRDTPVLAFGNWVLALWELYIRDNCADRYAVFQDDFVTYRGLRDYLERCKLTPSTYWNLYTFRNNEHVVAGKPVGWYEAATLRKGSDQCGRGAIGLVFDRPGVVTLLSQKGFVEKPMDANRGTCAIDGGVVCEMNKAGYREMVHNPSLVQHIGEVSSMGNNVHKQAETFRGEDFDAREFR